MKHVLRSLIDIQKFEKTPAIAVRYLEIIHKINFEDIKFERIQNKIDSKGTIYRG